MKRIPFALFLFTFNLQLSTVLAQSTDFTYQGRLNVSGSPANGLYDFRFRLASDPLANNYIGNSYVTNGVGVTNGLFITTMDFGNIFNGSNYWLEVDVRANGVGSYTMLNPLQAVKPSPYAIYAASAGNLAGGLIIQQKANGAPNIIGGASVNFISDNVSGGTISGGGAGNYLGLGTFSNSVTADFGTIGGGAQNIITNTAATVGGGFENTAGGIGATIGGGDLNTASGQESVISGGANNTASGDYSTVAGGYNNAATNGNATVNGGDYNIAGGLWAAVSGGVLNIADGEATTIGGGQSNRAGGENTTVSGGYQNTADNIYATVGGGGFNTANNYYTTVSGGGENNANGQYATVSGGYTNIASGQFATVSGGYTNIAIGNYSTVSGGSQNVASGQYSTVSGFNNTASGSFSCAMGSNAKATNNGAFVWAEPIGQYFYSTADNQFSVRAIGGVRFVSSAGGSGVSLAPGSGSWSSLSDRTAKENFQSVNTQSVLKQVADMSLTTWNYKTQDKAIRHIGPIAQDFYTAFGVGEDERHITEVDEGGVALAAIQGLNQKLEDRTGKLEKENVELKSQVNELKKMVMELTKKTQ